MTTSYDKVWSSIYAVVHYIHESTHQNLKLFYYVAMQLSFVNRLDYRKYMRIEFTIENQQQQSTINVEAYEATYASLAKLGALAKSQRIVICTAPWMYDLSTRMFASPASPIPEPTTPGNSLQIPNLLIEFFNSFEHSA